jgi:hypothetical protein
MMQALFINAGTGNLIIPVSVVAQIVGAVAVAPSRYDHEAIIGDITWRTFSMPLVRSSVMLGEGAEGDSGFERAVILWPMKQCKETEFFALTCFGSPRVVDARALAAPEPSEKTLPSSKILGYIQVESELAAVPDLGKVARDLFENQ